MKKSAIFLGAMLMISCAFAEGFTDVSGHWGKEYINKAAEKGYFSGYPDGTFLPENSITRMEFIIICTKFLNGNTEVQVKETDNAYIYEDVKEVEWALPIYKEFMSKVNIYGNTSYHSWGKMEIEKVFGENFEPYKPITREEAVAIFNIFIDDKYKSNSMSDFKDTMVATFPKSIATAAKLGIVNGYTDGSFKPFNFITRAEAAAMLLNFEKVTYAISDISYLDNNEIKNIYTDYMEPEEVVDKILKYEKNNEYYNSYQLHDEEVAWRFGYASYLTYYKDTFMHSYIENWDLDNIKYTTKIITDNKAEVYISDGTNLGIKTLKKNNGKWYAYFGMVIE